jgi:hypothetical protein
MIHGTYTETRKKKLQTVLGLRDVPDTAEPHKVEAWALYD